jgi:protein-disulfide isomerase
MTTQNSTQTATNPVIYTATRWAAAIVIIAAIFSLGLGTGYYLWGRPEVVDKITQDARQTSAGNSAANNPAKPQEADYQNIKRYAVPVDDDPFLGPENAAITIIEFSDFECPFCQSWYSEVWPKIQQAYPGKVRLVYRDFPLYGLHSNASTAAEAATCANEQKKYWEFHDRLFSNRLPLGRSGYESYAQELKLDMTAFRKCMDERRYEKEVKADYDFASQLGVRSTPTFFINGIALVGAQPFDVFKQVIDLELAGKLPKN